MKRNSEPIQMDIRSQQRARAHFKRPLDEDELPLDATGPEGARDRKSRRRQRPSRSRSSSGASSDAEPAASDQDDELGDYGTPLAAGAQRPPDDEMIFELQQVDQVEVEPEVARKLHMATSQAHELAQGNRDEPGAGSPSETIDVGEPAPLVSNGRHPEEAGGPNDIGPALGARQEPRPGAQRRGASELAVGGEQIKAKPDEEENRVEPEAGLGEGPAADRRQRREPRPLGAIESASLMDNGTAGSAGARHSQLRRRVEQLRIRMSNPVKVSGSVLI